MSDYATPKPLSVGCDVLFGPCSCGAKKSPTHDLDEVCWWCGKEKGHITFEEWDASREPSRTRSEYEVFLMKNAPTRQQLESNQANRLKRIWLFLLETPQAMNRLAQKVQPPADPELVRKTLLRWQADGHPDPKQWLSRTFSQDDRPLSAPDSEGSVLDSLLLVHSCSVNGLISPNVPALAQSGGGITKESNS